MFIEPLAVEDMGQMTVDWSYSYEGLLEVSSPISHKSPVSIHVEDTLLKALDCGTSI